MNRVKFGVWIATFSILFALHWIYRVEARRLPDQYARVIEQYKRVHGTYPKNLKAAGLVELDHRKLDYAFDPPDIDPPLLEYDDTVSLNRWSYDFQQHSWQLNGD